MEKCNYSQKKANSNVCNIRLILHLIYIVLFIVIIMSIIFFMSEGKKTTEYLKLENSYNKSIDSIHTLNYKIDTIKPKIYVIEKPVIKEVVKIKTKTVFVEPKKVNFTKSEIDEFYLNLKQQYCK